MENKIVADIISNLRGKKVYEEKKARKLGYPSLVEYFEDKLKSEAEEKLNREKKRSLLKNHEKKKYLLKKAITKKQKSCSCC